MKTNQSSAFKTISSFYSSKATFKVGDSFYSTYYPLKWLKLIEWTNLKFEDLQLELHKTKPNLPEDPAKLLFGQKFTDHMLTVEWTKDAGWGKPKLGPFKNLEIHPAAKVLHYSIELFEGMKAYYGVDGKIRIFRPDLNALRMFKSAARSGLPVTQQKRSINPLSYNSNYIFLNNKELRSTRVYKNP